MVATNPHFKSEARLFSLRANMAGVWIPQEITLQQVNAVKADIYRAVCQGSQSALPETHLMRGHRGTPYATRLNHKYRMLWKWTDPSNKTARDGGITIISIVASDKQND